MYWATSELNSLFVPQIEGKKADLEKAVQETKYCLLKPHLSGKLGNEMNEGFPNLHSEGSQGCMELEVLVTGNLSTDT